MIIITRCVSLPAVFVLSHKIEKRINQRPHSESIDENTTIEPHYTMVSDFDGCTETCGWIAAVVAAITYGSYGVPIKATKDIDVHPLGVTNV